MADSLHLLLGPYRVLDLTGGDALLCGKILADLGADVIQLEPVDGSTSRRTGPFYDDDPRPDRSLLWWAYCANKRSITLNLESADGRIIFKRLMEKADFLIESFPPGYMAGLGLGYRDLEQVNPSLVMVSITDFGQDGPYAGYQATDIIGMALGGFMHLTGDGDRPPLTVGCPQAQRHGAAAGAMGAMVAHTHRALTGEGQHVDVSCQQAVAKALAHAPQSWDVEGVIIQRMGAYRQTSEDTRVRVNWPCRDGHINYMLQGGSVAWSTRNMLSWMDEEGLGNPDLEGVGWEELGYGQVTDELMDRAAGPLEEFFRSHTREELARGSAERRILLFPVATYGDLLEHPQLRARDYFVEVEHPELGRWVTHPGAFVKAEGVSTGPRRRPPLTGEHNHEVYGGGLGLSPEEMVVLREVGVI